MDNVVISKTLKEKQLPFTLTIEFVLVKYKCVYLMSHGSNIV